MEKAGSDEAPPGDPPAPAPDPPPSRQSRAARLVSGLATGRARQGVAGGAADCEMSTSPHGEKSLLSASSDDSTSRERRLLDDQHGHRG